MVAIKTGDIESAKATPVERWGRLVEKWQAVTYFFPHDCRKLKQMRDECNELNMWQVLGYSSKDEFYREGLLVDPTVVELACLAIEEAPDVKRSLDDAVEIGRAIKKEQDRAKSPDIEKLRKGGGNNNPSGSNQHKKAEVSVDNINTVRSGRPDGTSKAYVVRRLVKMGRDDLLDRIEAGELSANAAAIEAGFRKPPQPPIHKLPEPERLQVLYKTLTETKDWADGLVALLTYNELVILIEAAKRAAEHKTDD